jgi:hypothetical protein
MLSLVGWTLCGDVCMYVYCVRFTALLCLAMTVGEQALNIIQVSATHLKRNLWVSCKQSYSSSLFAITCRAR